MQREGRAKMNRPAHGLCFEQELILDQHTANTWKVAQESARIGNIETLREMLIPELLEDKFSDYKSKMQYNEALQRAIYKLTKQHD